MSRRRDRRLINENDIVGRRVGRLIVVQHYYCYYENTKGGKRRRHDYICACDCGNYTVVRRDDLLSEKSRSCGCLRRKVK